MPFPARVAHWIVLAMFGAVIALAAGGVAGNDNRITDRTVPRDFEGEAAFLELLKHPSEPHGAFRVQDAPRWNAEMLARYIPAEGTDFLDVNNVHNGHVGKSEFLRSIQTREGLAFAVMSHLAHIYSIPYRQYSELHFSRDSGSHSTVTVARWYRLTFRRDPEGPVLVKCEYLTEEGD